MAKKRQAPAKPATPQPPATQPPATQPTATRPTATRPTATQPAAKKPSAKKPTAKKRSAAAKATERSRLATAPAATGSRVAASRVAASRDVGALSAAELAALALSLAHLGAGPQSVTARRGLRHALEHLEFDDDVIATTLATLTTPLPDDIARRARVVANAITARQVIRIQYLDAASRLTIRDLEPVTCLVHRDFWYLVGWCRLRGAIRAFRFDRVIAVEPTDIPSRPHLPDHYLPFQRRTPAA